MSRSPRPAPAYPARPPDQDDVVGCRRFFARKNVEHYDRDVVGPATVKRQAHEIARCLPGISLIEQHLGNLLLAKLVREPVAAEQEAAARLEVELPAVRFDLGLDPERSRQDVPMRVDAGLVRGQLAASDHLLDHAVIIGQLEDPLPGPIKQIRPRITDVHEREPQLVVRLVPTKPAAVRVVPIPRRLRSDMLRR